MLDVRRLKVLREVAARGSFSAAAESLAYTQSAVSQQIAALEREAGVPLVDRGTRGVRLTEAGRALVIHADAILARLADAEAELDAIAGLRGGRLRLSSFPSAGATLMPPAVAAFRQAHPVVELSLAQAEPDDGITRLRAGEFDLALSLDAEFCELDGEDIERTHLLEDPMYVALPCGHRLADRATLRLAELAEEAWVLGSTAACPDAAILLRACHAAGFEPRIAFESDDYLAIQGFIAAGVGVALIPDLALTTVRNDIVIRSLGRRPPVRRVFAATLAGGYCSPATAAMLEILVAIGAEFATGREKLALAS
ncbi:MAG: LysR substrate-binding domain-containing protein [Solirubrobacteraceae bacterium]|nr:MAG: LysR family transcriptional regulator [Solirubrobacterales bacterium]